MVAQLEPHQVLEKFKQTKQQVLQGVEMFILVLVALEEVTQVLGEEIQVLEEVLIQEEPLATELLQGL